MYIEEHYNTTDKMETSGLSWLLALGPLLSTNDTHSSAILLVFLCSGRVGSGRQHDCARVTSGLSWVGSWQQAALLMSSGTARAGRHRLHDHPPRPRHRRTALLRHYLVQSVPHLLV